MTLEIDPNIQKEARKLARRVTREVKKDERVKMGGIPELSISQIVTDDGEVRVQAGSGYKVDPCPGCP